MNVSQYNPELVLKDVTEETQRTLNLCNACRYCEGFCPVFPAVHSRRWFDDQNTSDIDYLSHLCHNCSACYHACQYKPPHAYQVNLPKNLSYARHESFKRHTWPGFLSRGFDNNPLLTTLAICLGLFITLSMGYFLEGPTAITSEHTGPGAFYQVISHGAIVLCAGSSLAIGVFSMLVSWRRYARSIGMHTNELSFSIVKSTLQEAASLRHLGGGHGEGCNTQDERFSNQRRYYHQFTMWGFVLCFAATCVATVYELLLGQLSPFPITSLPVLLGIVGGIGLIVGPIGLMVLKVKTPADVVTDNARTMDYTLSILLLLISLTGFALLIFRETSAMGLLLIVHLAFVLAFFITLPVGKFIHSGYRFIALLKSNQERFESASA